MTCPAAALSCLGQGNALTPLVRAHGLAVSQATVGRILRALIERQRILPASLRRKRVRARRRMRRWHAQRLPRACPKPTTPGERIQIDTLHVCSAPGRWIKHFSASCPVSCWTVADVADRATSTTAARFLEKVLHECPFPVAAIQVDGGSEFRAAFEAAYQHHGLALYILPPKSPKLNGTVERMQQTWRGEFYDAYELPWTLAEPRPLVQRFKPSTTPTDPTKACTATLPPSTFSTSCPGSGYPHLSQRS